MSKQTKLMIAALSVLGILLLYNAWFFASKNKRGQRMPPRLENAVSAAERKPSGGKQAQTPQYIAPKPVYRDYGRDPFLLPIEVAEGVPYHQVKVDVQVIDEHPDNLERLDVYRLSGILYDKTHPVAIIDGRVCRIGTALDKIFTIEEIHRDHVVLRDDRQTYRMSLRGAEALPPPDAGDADAPQQTPGSDHPDLSGDVDRAHPPQARTPLSRQRPEVSDKSSINGLRRLRRPGGIGGPGAQRRSPIVPGGLSGENDDDGENDG